MKKMLYLITITTLLSTTVMSQAGDPKLTEVWKPEPPVVIPGNSSSDAPSDALVLLGNNSPETWESEKKGGTPEWNFKDGIFTVKPGTGGIRTKQGFGSCQLHIEWRTPSVVKGEGQGRGNSGIFLMGKYELQVLDNYNNTTYSNGQAGSIYKQQMPLVNACRKPGEWQTYDVIFTAPQFYEDGRLKDPARITVLHNGVLIQYNTTITGETGYIGIARYSKHADKLPLMLQDHGDLVSYRNIWIRPL